MAILQTIQTQSGVPATYWKISSVVFNLSGSCSMRVDGYFDETARRDNYDLLKQFSYTIDSTDMATVFPSGFNLGVAYAFVKTQTEFSFGSVDLY